MEAMQALTTEMHAQKLVPLAELKESCRARGLKRCSCAPLLQHIGSARGAEPVCRLPWLPDWAGWENSSITSVHPAGRTGTHGSERVGTETQPDGGGCLLFASRAGVASL